MAFHGVNQTYLVERASIIAVKWGLTYSIDRKVFVGPPYCVAAATAELNKWISREQRKALLAAREQQ
jgi:hypothetical protein